ncbi:hypothetical protein [Flavobacterium turcicum]|uniref:Lipoprotein n=1 Tax=Flavobacterium turcicum TaxID=2764718 RepID=A0ABR7JHQ5_9FLAO|nr:hypothetical protein [Flavobacterium turcicum]MBC5864019.1 hypothetical protein [Flavobacterium turcicum]NHL02785.1 hypothetical protein [Flavobacterium turcicum]
MKQFLLIAISFLVFSCKKANSPADENVLYYEQPQPIHDAELTQIPLKFRGVFVNSDSVHLTISEKMILREFDRKFRIHKTELDSLKQEFDFKNDKYFFKGDNRAFIAKNIGDSIEFVHTEIDTVFIFSKTQKAKRFNGKLVLNYKDSLYWAVNTIDLAKNVLYWKTLGTKDDVRRMDSLTQVKSIPIDSLTYLAKPTRNEFKTFINLKRLQSDEVFKKSNK